MTRRPTTNTPTNDQRTRRRAHIARLEGKRGALTTSEQTLLRGLRGFEADDPALDVDDEIRTALGLR